MNADGSGVTRLTHTGFRLDWQHTWNPDGERIAFSSRRDGDFEIYVMNADGTGLARLTDNDAADKHPAWSPDGQRIAFDSNRDGTWEIYVMNADGDGLARLTYDDADDGSFWALRPVWSPDGKRIAFHSKRDGNWEIYVMSAGGEPVRASTRPAGVAPGECYVGLIVQPGGSCRYPGTSQGFSVSASGRGNFGFSSGGTGVYMQNTTINGVLYNFAASKQSDGNWIIEAAG